MKTILTFFIVAFFCNSIVSQSSANLKYNLTLNNSYSVKSMSTQDQKTTMQGMEQISELKNITYFSIKALNNAADFFMAQVKFDTLITTNSMPKMEMTSAKPGNMKSEDATEIMNCFYNRLSNSTLLVKMDYSGHVIDILNYDVVAKVILADVDSIKGQMGMSVKPRITIMAEKQALKGMIEAITVYLPNKEVSKGDKWNANFKNSAGGFGMLVSMDIVLEDLQKDEAKISSDVTIEPAGDKPMEMNGAKISSELRGIGKAEMLLDPKTGWIKSGSSKMQLSGNLNINAQGQDMQMPMEIAINGELTGLN